MPLPLKQPTVDGVNSILGAMGKPPNKKLGQIVHAILFLVAVLVIFGGAKQLWFAKEHEKSVQVTNVTIESGGVGNFNTLAGALRSQQPTSTLKEPLVFYSGEVENGKIIATPHVKIMIYRPSEKIESGIYKTDFALFIGVAPGQNQPTINNFTPKNNELICPIPAYIFPPSIVSSGEFVGRVLYSYFVTCSSPNPITTSTPSVFEMFYAY